MTAQEEYILSCYPQIGVLSEAHGVFLVQHIQSGQVFVKKILTEYNADVYRYLREHPIPHTAKIEELIEDEGTLIVIERYLSGTTLEKHLREHGPLAPKEAVSFVRQLAVIVGQLHRADPPIIHRDIKPSNVMLEEDGSVALLDMNAAKWYDTGKSEDTKLIGTVGYAAPEQYGFGTSCRQTDIYALGVLLNELLTGDLPKNRQADGYLGDLIQTCIKIDPADRFPDTDALIAALDNCGRKNTGAKKKSAARFLPPGFRARKTRYMIPAALWYLLILFFGLTLEVENGSVLSTWLNRGIFFLMMLSITFFTGNYLDVWNRIGLTRIRKPAVRICVIILIDIAICLLLFNVLVVLENYILR